MCSDTAVLWTIKESILTQPHCSFCGNTICREVTVAIYVVSYTYFHKGWAPDLELLWGEWKYKKEPFSLLFSIGGH